MKTKRAYDFTIDFCDTCAGIWLDKEEFLKIVRYFDTDDRRIEKEFEIWFKDDEAEYKALRSNTDFHSPITCPKDYSNLIRREYAHNSNVHLDVCSKCGGYWFDGHEIQKIRELLRPDQEFDAVVKAIRNSVRRQRQDADRAVRSLFNTVINIIPTASTKIFVVIMIYVVDLVFDLVELEGSEAIDGLNSVENTR